MSSRTFEIEAVYEILDTALVEADSEEEAIEKYKNGDLLESDPHRTTPDGEITIVNVREIWD